MAADRDTFINSTVLPVFKKSYGDLSGTGLDDVYKTYILAAYLDLVSDDISEDVLQTELGVSCLVVYAAAVADGNDPTTNNTVNLLRWKLSTATKVMRDEMVVQ